MRKDKISELLAGLKKRQYAFTGSRDVSDGAVIASYLIENELVKASRPFSDGELVKICMMKAVEVVCPNFFASPFTVNVTEEQGDDHCKSEPGLCVPS